MAKKQSGEYVRIETLTPDPRNANTHNQRSIDAITRSLKAFGQQKPIVVGADGVIIAGNGTREAALALGWESIWIVRSELSGDEARAFAIADNRAAEFSEWNFDQLNEQLDNLIAAAPGLFDAAGFSEDELSKIHADRQPAAHAEPPAEFREFDETIETDHACPKCGYQWSGKQQ